MNQIIGIAVTLAFVVSTAYAADEKKPTSQQEKMKACNTHATDKQLKGDERKAFMSECLKAKPDDSAGEDDRLQQGRDSEEPQRGRAQGVHERLPQGRQEVLAGGQAPELAEHRLGGIGPGEEARPFVQGGCSHGSCPCRDYRIRPPIQADALAVPPSRCRRVPRRVRDEGKNTPSVVAKILADEMRRDR
jgi:psiF repeat